jgi:hypothetical protein
VKIALPRRRARPDIPGLAPGERPLAWADVGLESHRTGESSATGRHWAGTASALYVPSDLSASHSSGSDGSGSDGSGSDGSGSDGSGSDGSGSDGSGSDGSGGDLLESAAPSVRIPWTHIERADWDEASQQLRVREIAPFGEVGATHTARLLGAERLLQLVRERVTAAVVRTQEVPYSGGGSFRVLARRPDDGSAGFVWSIELPPGADPGDPRVAAEAAGALTAVQTDLGIDG